MAKAVRKVDPGYLERVALWYLERWDAPPAGLRRILMKRVRRSVEAHGTDPEEAAVWVDAVVARATEAGLVSDARYARDAVARWRARGGSAGRIRAALGAKGVPAEVIAEALARDASDTDIPPDHLAALRYARRRRFGPWRTAPKDADGLRKELASLGRQGFSYAIARAVVDLDDRDAAEDALRGT
jgi:regulatory protein